jgi:hypothetical protein
MTSRSLIFFNGIFTDWFRARIEPWKHYVPFAPDFSDLEERILWAMENDAEAKRIADRAYAFAHAKLTVNNMRCYAGLLLLEYADLLY